jgi:hypothetical protein
MRMAQFKTEAATLFSLTVNRKVSFGKSLLSVNMSVNAKASVNTKCGVRMRSAGRKNQRIIISLFVVRLRVHGIKLSLCVRDSLTGGKNCVTSNSTVRTSLGASKIVIKTVTWVTLNNPLSSVHEHFRQCKSLSEWWVWSQDKVKGGQKGTHYHFFACRELVSVWKKAISQYERFGHGEERGLLAPIAQPRRAQLYPIKQSRHILRLLWNSKFRDLRHHWERTEHSHELKDPLRSSSGRASRASKWKLSRKKW